LNLLTVFLMRIVISEMVLRILSWVIFQTSVPDAARTGMVILQPSPPCYSREHSTMPPSKLAIQISMLLCGSISTKILNSRIVKK
jgi:hypothetical protein